MKITTAFLILLYTLSLHAQQKGATPLKTQNPELKTGSTYAVIIGISDYQNEGIPDLRFADRDAEAFAAFLQSLAGGSLDKDHLKVLLNEQATSGNVAAALYWLIDETKEGDQVILYFSGHGDVERKIMGQPGFLLCWDAPPKVYMAGGVVQIGMFQSVISTLSVENKAKVTVITDACRSGKLAGSEIGGSQLTNANLAKQYTNEIKILSCQPDEYSIEGEQWGGGRGAFSYHLLDGLYGLADGNGDLSVNLLEIGRYLEDHVTEEVAPHSQIPMTVGSRSEKLTKVVPDLLAQLREGKKGQMQLFNTTDSRGLEEEVLANVDSNIVETYLAFKKAVEDKIFLSPEGACADAYYGQLIQVPALKPLHNAIRRNYAAALQDDAQQAINLIMSDDVTEAAKTFWTLSREAENHPAHLRRAAELLGPEHYMHDILLARSHYYQGYLVLLKKFDLCRCYDPNLAHEILPSFHKALEYQPDMPLVWLSMGHAYGVLLQQIDSMEYYANLARENTFDWITLRHGMGHNYLAMSHSLPNKDELLEKSKKWLDEGYSLDSNSVMILEALSYWYNLNQQHDKEIEMLDKAIAIDSLALLIAYKGFALTTIKRYEEAEKAYLQAIKMDSTLITEQYGLAALYSHHAWNKPQKLLEVLERIVEIDATLPWLNQALSSAYRANHQYEKIEENLIKQLQDDPTASRIFYQLVMEYLSERQPDLARRIPNLFGKLITANHAPLDLWNYKHIAEGLLMVLGPAEATQALEGLIELDSSYIGIYVALGTIHLKTGNLTKAREYGDKIISLTPPGKYKRYTIFGGAIYETEEWEELIQLTKKEKEIDSLEKVRLVTLYALHHGDREEASKYGAKLLKLGPENEMDFLILGSLYYQTGDYAQAEKMLNKALEVGQNIIPRTQLMLALLYQQTNRLPAAEEMMKQAMSQPSDCIRRIGLIMRNQPFYEEWETLLLKLQTFFQNNGTITLELSRVYAKTNQPEKAFQYLDRTLASDNLSFANGGQRQLANHLAIPWEPNLNPLIDQYPERWEEVVKKHFPEQHKD